MSNIPEKISELDHERDHLINRKRAIQSKLEEVRSDLNEPSLDPSQKEQLEELRAELKEELREVIVGINAVEEDLSDLQGGESTQDDLSNVAKKAESVLEKVEDGYDTLEEKQRTFDQTIEDVEETQEKIEELEESARGLLERSTSSALGEQFSERKSELERNLVYWKAASIGSILILMGSAGAIYYDIITSDSTVVLNLSKIAIILPISVAVWFSVSNYSRQKKLMEEYEFKARMALSLTGFREVLQEETTDENDEIVAEFVVESMNKIYSNPQENIQATEQNEQNSPLTPGQKPLVELIQRLGK